MKSKNGHDWGVVDADALELGLGRYSSVVD
jgi:hypothetical protein